MISVSERNVGEWEHGRAQMIEILSPRDCLVEMQERVDDYLGFGVGYVWVINPRTRQTWIYDPNGPSGIA